MFLDGIVGRQGMSETQEDVFRGIWKKITNFFRKSSDDVRKGAAEELGEGLVDGLAIEDDGSPGRGQQEAGSRQRDHHGVDFPTAEHGEGHYFRPDGENGKGQYLQNGNTRYWDADFDGTIDFVEIRYSGFSGFDYDNDGYNDATGSGSYWGD